MSDRPVTTIYERPWERVLFSPERDANPFFHFAESLWMLAGRKDLAFVTKFVKRMMTFSDDGFTLHGAYGYRWRKHFLNDQVAWAIRRLRKDENDRRVVIQMWDANEDMAKAGAGGKDVPCNTQCYVWVDTEGRLSLTVLCRSNDAIWGAHGANAVHFSYLQEYIACAIGRSMGCLYQVSNNYHAYEDLFRKMVDAREVDLYTTDELVPSSIPMFDASHEVFDEDVKMLLEEGVTIGLRSAWLRRVAVPILHAHAAYKDIADDERWNKAYEILQQCQAPDWKLGCEQWLTRRKIAHFRAADDGVPHES